MIRSSKSPPGSLTEILTASESYEGQIEAVGFQEPRDAEFADVERPLDPSLREHLSGLGITSLYSHQAIAFDLAVSGHDVVVVTGTGSGKSLCYLLPVLHTLTSLPAGKSLHLFPTKALAHDQLEKTQAMLPVGIRASAYDGDTPQEKRKGIRQSAQIILTNPDMLHLAILPNHSAWKAFLKNLRFIVVDELHNYSGVFGSHVALVLRRLLRLSEWYGSRPAVIATSATIRNPVEHFHALTGRSAELIQKDGAPSGGRDFVMWNPPELKDGSRRSTLREAAAVASHLIASGRRTMIFARSRLAAELVLGHLRSLLEDSTPEAAKRIDSYRSGYTPEDRRIIEKKLHSGELLAICTTTALELGVDIGHLDAVVIAGFPGSVASIRQQAGRAGRGAKRGFAVFVANEDALDQYLMRHPERLLGSEVEAVRVRPENPFVLASQLRCAAHERPIAASELDEFPPGALQCVESLEEEGLLKRSGGLWFVPGHESPAASVDIRGVQKNSYDLLLDGEKIGDMEEWRTYQAAHPGAIYLHRGESYRVTKLDTISLNVELERADVGYYTQALAETSVLPKVELASAPLGEGNVRFEGVDVTTIVTAYRKRELLTGEVLEVAQLDMPPHTISTIAVRVGLPSSFAADDPDAQAGVHALEHVLASLAPIIAQCDPRDVGSAFYSSWLDHTGPVIFVHDSVLGGAGIAQALFEDVRAWVGAALDLLESCGCTSGCPGCILSPRCPYSNEALDKAHAAKAARALLR